MQGIKVSDKLCDLVSVPEVPANIYGSESSMRMDSADSLGSKARRNAAAAA